MTKTCSVEKSIFYLLSIYYYIYKSESMFLAMFVCMLLGSGGLLLCSGGVSFGVGQGHNNGVAFSLGSIPRTRWWANVVFSFRSVPRLYKEWNCGRTMTMTNDRPDLSSEGAHAIDKTILVNVNRNKYPVVRPTWALKPGLTDRLVVGHNVTLTWC
jgi:hypothetical protein